jgi:hypothetical protein
MLVWRRAACDAPRDKICSVFLAPESFCYPNLYRTMHHVFENKSVECAYAIEVVTLATQNFLLE